MTDQSVPVPDVLAELEASEQAETSEARQRYWTFVDRLAGDDALTTEETTELSKVLRSLGTTADAMRTDVETLRGLRRLAADDSDPQEKAREAYAAAKQKALDADAQVAEAQAALREAEQQQRQAHWQRTGLLEGIQKAAVGHRAKMQYAGECISALLHRGAPHELLPRPGEAPPPPRVIEATVDHECQVPTIHGHAVVHPGQVVRVHEDALGGPLRAVDPADVEVRPDGSRVFRAHRGPRWRVRVVRSFREDGGRGVRRTAGDVYETSEDPTSNPCLAIVPDDGEQDGEHEHDYEGQDEQEDATQ